MGPDPPDQASRDSSVRQQLDEKKLSNEILACEIKIKLKSSFRPRRTTAACSRWLARFGQKKSTSPLFWGWRFRVDWHKRKQEGREPSPTHKNIAPYDSNEAKPTINSRDRWRVVEGHSKGSPKCKEEEV
jgi:hypothetical protein